VDHPKIERTAISKAKRQLGTFPVQIRHVEVAERCDVTLHFQIRRNRFAFLIGEVLIAVR
jgi:hypothetical protein